MDPAVFWFRRDLRLEDNHGLYKALQKHSEVIPLFIFDEGILVKLSDKSDKRVQFIHQTLTELNKELKNNGKSGLLVLHGEVHECWKEVIKKYSPSHVYTNNDYEPQAIKRDMEVERLLAENGIGFHSFKDQVIFEESEVMKDDGEPYTVFTPYSKKWRSRFKEYMYQPYPSLELIKNFTEQTLPHSPALKEIGFEEVKAVYPSRDLDRSKLKKYDKVRDFPALDATSHQSVHLRFGTVSIRKLVKDAMNINQTFLSELIWREFFMMILYHFPNSVNQEFREKYRDIKWRYDVEDFKRWCFGKTGYPIVDAGMRELNETGYMHNRVRMITASFLVKHLLIDWRWGERYFAKKLLDFELSANVGNWQWAAGTGCDAAPYFRIFNPYTQAEKFDKDKEYIKKWVPEFGTSSYPKPMVDHAESRERALSVYKAGILV